MFIRTWEREKRLVRLVVHPLDALVLIGKMHVYAFTYYV